MRLGGVQPEGGVGKSTITCNMAAIQRRQWRYHSWWSISITGSVVSSGSGQTNRAARSPTSSIRPSLQLSPLHWRIRTSDAVRTPHLLASSCPRGARQQARITLQDHTSCATPSTNSATITTWSGSTPPALQFLYPIGAHRGPAPPGSRSIATTFPAGRSTRCLKTSRDPPTTTATWRSRASWSISSSWLRQPARGPGTTDEGRRSSAEPHSPPRSRSRNLMSKQNR